VGAVTSNGCALYHEEVGEGVPLLLVHPAGATASTWGSAVERLARIGHVITYDRRGYARSGGEPVRSMATHTADAAAMLECLQAAPAVILGTSAGAAIAVDLAVRRSDLVRVVVAHEFPWRFTRHLPDASQVSALVEIGALTLRGRHEHAVNVLLRSAYAYRDGGSAWDAFPEEWRRVARENARPSLADFRHSIATYPSGTDLATVRADRLRWRSLPERGRADRRVGHGLDHDHGDGGQPLPARRSRSDGCRPRGRTLLVEPRSQPRDRLRDHSSRERLADRARQRARDRPSRPLERFHRPALRAWVMSV